MGRTVYWTATSIDGFIAGPGNDLEWLLSLESDGGAFEGFLDGVGAMTMGASTYRWVVEHEQLVDHPERWREWYADRPTWVFTHRDLPALPLWHRADAHVWPQWLDGVRPTGNMSPSSLWVTEWRVR